MTLGDFGGRGGGTKMVLPPGMFGQNGEGSISLQPKPLPTILPPPNRPNGPTSSEGRVFAAFQWSAEAQTGISTPPAGGQPGQPSPVEKPVQLLQKLPEDLPEGFQLSNASFFRNTAPTGTRSAQQAGSTQWEKVPTIVDTTNRTAIANTNVPGEYVLMDSALVAQTQYTAYVPAVEPGTLLSSVTIRNGGTEAGTVTLSFTRADGSVALSHPVGSVAAGASALVYVPSLTDLGPGSYALTIVSTQPVSVVSNLSVASTSASSGYGAIAASDLVLNFPQVYRGYFGYDSNIVLQNAGTTAATVSVSYVNQAGLQVATESATIAAGGKATLDQSANTSISEGFAGSATVTSSARLAGIVNVVGSGGTLMSTIIGVGAGAQQAYLPALYKAYYGFNSSMLVQNVDASEATIEIVYSSGLTKTATIPVGASLLYYQPNEASLPDGWQGSAVVRTTNATRIVAVGNVSSATGRLSAYNAPIDGATEVILPALYNRYSAANWTSSATIQNVDSAATDVEIVYGDGWVQQITNLGAGQSQLVYQPNVTGLTGAWQGAATVRSVGGKRLIVVVNEDSAASDKDWLISYVGFGS